MTQNCIPPSEFIIPNRECAIRLGIGEGAKVIFKQVSHLLDSQLLHFCIWSVVLWTVLHCVTNCELCIVSRWPSSASGVGFTLPQLEQIDLSGVDVPLNTKQTNNCSSVAYSYSGSIAQRVVKKALPATPGLLKFWCWIVQFMRKNFTVRKTLLTFFYDPR